MEKNLSTLIVDDEKRAVELLNSLLKDTGQFSEIRTAESAPAALAVLEHFTPDLIFLDIKMPERDGFKLLKDLKTLKVKSSIIFVTAYDQYALDALREHAFGYLLKPVNRTELSTCIREYREQKENNFQERIERLLNTYEEKSKLRFNTRTGYILIDPSQVLYCQADGNYTVINLGDKRHVCSVQLGAVEGILPVNGFLRLGRSLIINFNYVIQVDRKAARIVFEKEGQEFNISVSKIQIRELEKKQ